MSTWRRKALEFLPNYRNTIQQADSASMLWCDLSSDFRIAVDKNDQNFINGTLKYLVWSTSDIASKETQGAVYCGFLEDITSNKKHWSYFRDWFNKTQFEKYKGSFSYSLSEKDYKLLENQFYGK